jgi:hypothetical protein
MTREKISFKPLDEIAVHESEVKNIIALMAEYYSLNSRFGYVSCLDVPEAYDRMEEIQNEIEELLISEYAGVANMMTNNVSIRKIREVLESIAYDVHNNNVNLEAVDISFYTQDEFICEYVCSNFNEQQQELFDSLFYWINSDSRGAWLYQREYDSDTMYTNGKYMDFVFMVNK